MSAGTFKIPPKKPICIYWDATNVFPSTYSVLLIKQMRKITLQPIQYRVDCNWLLSTLIFTLCFLFAFIEYI